MDKSISSRFLALTGALVCLAAWELSFRQGWLNPFILPSPFTVAGAVFEMASSGELWRDAWQSILRVLTGFTLSVLIGTPLGFALGLSPRLKALVDPILQFLRPIPPIAWIPLTILWFGLGDGPAYSLTMIASFFPIVLSALFGVESLDRRHLDVARCFGASRWQVFREVVFPSALPSLLSGYRIGFGIAWMAVMGAEMIATPSGLGYLIQVSQNMIRTDRVIAGMMTIGAIGFCFDLAFRELRRRWLRWA